MRFARDQVFASPSAAAAVIIGRQANGRVEWKAEGSGISFGSWEDRGIDQAVGKPCHNMPVYSLIVPGPP
jgi:hypothetical protein